MERDKSNKLVAGLLETPDIQRRMGTQLEMEWASCGMGHLVAKWKELEVREDVAYEDKVKKQIEFLRLARKNLYYISKQLGKRIRVIEAHQKKL